MYKGTISASTTLTANTTIPFATILNTNDNTQPINNGAVALKNTGYYNVQASVTVTGYTASSPIAIQLYDGETPIAESIASVMGSSTNTNAVTLTTPMVPIRVVRAISNYATISARVNGGATASAGVMSIEKVR